MKDCDTLDNRLDSMHIHLGIPHEQRASILKLLTDTGLRLSQACNPWIVGKAP